MLALVYCNFLKEVRLGGWGTEGPKALTLGQYVSACAKGITQSQEKVNTFKPNYILPLHNGMVAHALTYWPNVGPFGPSLPQPPNLTSLRKLQYTSARTNVTHASIVAHAT